MRKLIAATLAALVVVSTCAAQSEMLSILGPNGRVEVPHDPALVPETGLTVEAWVLWDPSTPWGGSWPTVARKGNQPHPYILRVDGAGRPPLVRLDGWQLLELRQQRGRHAAFVLAPPGRHP